MFVNVACSKLQEQESDATFSELRNKLKQTQTERYDDQITFEKQDINTINGCPEYKNLKWNMLQSEVETRIGSEYKYDGSSILEVKDKFLCWDNVQIFCEFENNKFRRLGAIISNVSVTRDEVVRVFTEIYGAHTRIGYDGTYQWDGEKTYISVEDMMDYIFVNYYYDINNEYNSLEYIDTGIDPFGLIGKNKLIGKSVNNIIGDFEEGNQYDVSYDTDFTMYMLYPRFEIVKSHTKNNCLAIFTPNDRSTVNLITYMSLFELNDMQNAIENIKATEKEMSATYGSNYQTEYALMSTFESGTATFEEMLNMIRLSQIGNYTLSWNSGTTIVSYTVSVNSAIDGYIMCGISYADSSIQ